MTHPCPEAFHVTDVEDFAKHLGLDGADADMFYECMYGLEGEWAYEWDEDEYRNEDKYENN